MSRMFGFDLKDRVAMWKAFTDSIQGWGFHIANARLFALSQMIEGHLNHSYWNDEEQFRTQLEQILMLIDSAKEATKNEKQIYLFTVSEWLGKIIETIEEAERQKKRQQEWEHEEALATQKAIEASENHQEKIESDAMGDIPF